MVVKNQEQKKTPRIAYVIGNRMKQWWLANGDRRLVSDLEDAIVRYKKENPPSNISSYFYMDKATLDKREAEILKRLETLRTAKAQKSEV